MRISDWSSDVCSSDLLAAPHLGAADGAGGPGRPRVFPPAQVGDPHDQRRDGNELAVFAPEDEGEQDDGEQQDVADREQDLEHGFTFAVGNGSRVARPRGERKIGRASGWERVRQYGWNSGGAV